MYEVNQMNTYTNSSFSSRRLFSKIRPTFVLALIIVTALLAFEFFNYSTTEYALSDLLGNIKFLGLRWATILSIAFCGIDFAGIARLFTPERGANESKAVWYLFGAWFLAAGMNAILTWWGVSMAVANHTEQSRAFIDARTLTTVVPVFVALMVWVIRILIIGTISVAGDRFLGGGGRGYAGRERSFTPASTIASPRLGGSVAAPRPSMGQHSAMPRPQPSNISMQAAPTGRPEPTYHSMSIPRPTINSGSGIDHNNMK
jgi:hypothetical protein